MSIAILWYVLAGFILGFTVSTLWEWLYYRGRRQRWQAEAAANAQVTTAWSTQTRGEPDELDEFNGQLPWDAPVYRSSSVLLESEQMATYPTPDEPPPPATWQPAFVQSSRPAPTGQPSMQFEEQTRRKTTAAPPNPAAPVHPPTVTASEKSSAPVEAAPAACSPVSAPDVTPPAVPEAAQPMAKIPPEPPPNPVDSSSITPVTNTATAANNAPATPPASTPVSDHPDDLTKIEGIGKAYKQRLYAAGIYTWQQVAHSDVNTLRRITRAKPNARPELWQKQAQELATQFNRQAATYAGPIPDDLTRIAGIGPMYADTLRQAGICTYEQLAAASPAALANILPTPAIGVEFNFVDWIKQARQQAAAKERKANLLP